MQASFSRILLLCQMEFQIGFCSSDLMASMGAKTQANQNVSSDNAKVYHGISFPFTIVG